ncbi:uncharacterized protein LOC144950598 [Lampetra fluviatilis]
MGGGHAQRLAALGQGSPFTANGLPGPPSPYSRNFSGLPLSAAQRLPQAGRDARGALAGAAVAPAAVQAGVRGAAGRLAAPPSPTRPPPAPPTTPRPPSRAERTSPGRAPYARSSAEYAPSPFYALPSRLTLAHFAPGVYPHGAGGGGVPNLPPGRFRRPSSPSSPAAAAAAAVAAVAGDGGRERRRPGTARGPGGAALQRVLARAAAGSGAQPQEGGRRRRRRGDPMAGAATAQSSPVLRRFSRTPPPA